jgi:fumarate reductase subunit D
MSNDAKPPEPLTPRSERRRFDVGEALLPFVQLGALSAIIFVPLWLLDFGLMSPLPIWTGEAAASTLQSFMEVTVAVLGVTITVVAIIVELAANRYTPRITELFVRDPINGSVMGFYVITCVLVVWIDMSLGGPVHPGRMALVAMALVTASLLSILPYFAYVFHFLTPEQVIRRIQESATHELLLLSRGRGSVVASRSAAVTAIEQLGDIAMASVDKKDKPLTLAAVEALANAAHESIALKSKLPVAFFDTRPLVRQDQDFIALHEDMVLAVAERQTWVEMKILRQYQSVFGEAVNRMRDVNHLIAIHTRRIALWALEAGDSHTQRLAVRFLNTYLRATLNARDVRSAYNLLNEYRLLAEAALQHGDHDLVVEIANHIKFYGQTAFSMQLAFLLETAAYDLCSLIEQASLSQAGCHDRLLGIFLELDREPDADGGHQETSLRGVRKAQIKLATHYLCRGTAVDTRYARRIFEDMHFEKRDRLGSIRAELERVQDAEYWEVSDRGINFEWLPPDRRAVLSTFFGWFEAVDAGETTND